MIDMVTAGELRAMGAELDERIPDCATIRSECVKMSLGKVSGAQTGRTLRVPIALEFTEPFSWVEIEGTVEV